MPFTPSGHDCAAYRGRHLDMLWEPKCHMVNEHFISHFPWKEDAQQRESVSSKQFATGIIIIVEVS